MSEGLLDALWRASLQGALALIVVGLLVRLFSRRLTADAQCWLWRVAYIKVLFSFITGGFLLIQLLSPTVISDQAAHHELTSVTLLTDARTLVSYSSDAAVYHLLDPLYSTSAWLRWQDVFAVLYLLGVGFCVARVWISLQDTRKTLRSLERIESGPARIAANSIAFNLGLERVPELARSANVTSPVLIAGTIVLPAGVEYDEDRLLMLLAHEMAHVQRRDLIWEWLGTVVQALFFFNPLVLMARREERLAREAAADSLAAQSTLASAHYYGAMLLDIALNQPIPQPALAGGVGVIEGGSPLRRRLLALRDTVRSPANRPTRVPWFVTMATCLAVAPWCLGVPGGFFPQSGPSGSSSAGMTPSSRIGPGNPAAPSVGFRVEFYYQGPGPHAEDVPATDNRLADRLPRYAHAFDFNESTTNAPIVREVYKALMLLKGRPKDLAGQTVPHKRLMADVVRGTALPRTNAS